MSTRIRARLALAVLVTSLVVAPAHAVTPPTFPVTVNSGGYKTTIPMRPTRIVSLSPSATEILYGIGAGSQVVAVDSLSNYPARAPHTDLSAYTPSAEAIAAYTPDLVVLSVDSVKSSDIRAALMTLNIPVVMEKAPRNINGAYAEMLTLGRATGHGAEARARITSMKQRIAAIIRSAKITAPVRFFHELDNTLYSATTTTFIGQVYRQIAPRSVNVADAAATADSGGYPQLSAEYLVSSNPQVIFLADAQYGESAQTVKERAAFAGIDAVAKNNVIALPADIPSRWGPRLVTLYAFIAKALARVQ